MRRIIPLLFILLFTATSFAQQNTSALINEALDKIYPLDLNTTLLIAKNAIGEQTDECQKGSDARASE